MENYFINKDDLELLNSFVGYGNFTNTDIFFLGIEEGAGRNEIEPGVVARLKYFGRDENGNFVNLVDGKDYKNGFYETSGFSGGKKVDKVKKEYGLQIEKQTEGIGKFPTLYIPARICLYLQNNYDPVWLSKFDDKIAGNEERKRKVDSYNLFDKNDNSVLSTALVDWKPLLRNTEEKVIKDVPVYKGIREKLYHRAFEKFEGDEEYVNLANKRFDLIVNLIIKSNSKVVMLFGNKPFMKNFVDRLCPNGTKQIDFEFEGKMPFGQEGYMENGTKVIWTYHPAATIKVGRYSYFKQVVEKSIAPVFK